jgi:demethylmenaquinone methyltransferase/2-methoxy-6-polyprenyl-1,4-benzoquinol methylase
MERTNWSYDSVARFYQALAHIYSFGLIRKSKNLQLKEIEEAPNKKELRILYVGCGSGEDAIQAAKLGADVTCIDISPKMIENTKKRFAQESAKATFICDNIFNCTDYNCYDIVTVNYFLNNFSADTLPGLLKHITSLLKNNGKLMIADFIALSKNKFIRSIQKANYYTAVFFFWLFRVAPLHRYQDYTRYFNDLGVRLERIDCLKLFKFGPVMYGNVLGIKIETDETACRERNMPL